jgi:hypothetical protein
MAGLKHPVTSDGRYFVVGGKLWRVSNPELDPVRRSTLVRELMDARRAVKNAKSARDADAEIAAIATSMKSSVPWESAVRYGGRTARRISTGNR